MTTFGDAWGQRGPLHSSATQGRLELVDAMIKRIAAIVGFAFALCTFSIPELAGISSVPFIGALQHLMFVLLVPGLICALTVGGNVHAFHLWVAAIGNFILYFCATLAVGAMWRRLRQPRTHRHE